jgi:hypothetical protein
VSVNVTCRLRDFLFNNLLVRLDKMAAKSKILIHSSTLYRSCQVRNMLRTDSYVVAYLVEALCYKPQGYIYSTFQKDLNNKSTFP